MREQAGLSWLAHPNPREGQTEMISSCLETLQKGGAHLASAPTGIGKTAAALAAALQFANSGPERKTVMFLTPRQSQHKIVVDTVRSINDISQHEAVFSFDSKLPAASTSEVAPSNFEAPGWEEFSSFDIPKDARNRVWTAILTRVSDGIQVTLLSL